MNLQQNLNEYWRNLEKKSKPPSHVSKLNIVDFKNIKKAVDNKNIFYIKNLMRKMYNGEAFILRNAAKKNLKKTIFNLKIKAILFAIIFIFILLLASYVAIISSKFYIAHPDNITVIKRGSNMEEVINILEEKLFEYRDKRDN